MDDVTISHMTDSVRELISLARELFDLAEEWRRYRL